MVPRTLDSIRAELRAMLPDLRTRYGVESLWVFGSRAREEPRAESDLDLMVQLPKGRLSLWEFIGLEQDIEERLGMDVDLVERRALHPAIRPGVLSEAVPV